MILTSEERFCYLAFLLERKEVKKENHMTLERRFAKVKRRGLVALKNILSGCPQNGSKQHRRERGTIRNIGEKSAAYYKGVINLKALNSTLKYVQNTSLVDRLIERVVNFLNTKSIIKNGY